MKSLSEKGLSTLVNIKFSESALLGCPYVQLSFTELSELLKGYMPRLIQREVLDRGLSPAEAEKEIAAGKARPLDELLDD